MGNLLGAPVTDKETHIGETEDGVLFGVSSMQGWRVHMEDAHIAEAWLYAAKPKREEGPPPNVDKIPLPGHSLFGVFDGHGGTFAAEYAGKNFCRVLSRQPRFVKYANFVRERPEKEAKLKGSADRVTYLRSGLDLLEGALRDAFVDIDMEIAYALKGILHPEANKPYHEEQAKEKDQMNDQSNSVSNTENDSNNASSNESNTEDMVGVSTENPQGTQQDDGGDSGTTACIVLITPEWIICANSGDSRAVISKHDHKAVPLSYDHKPDDEEEERRIRSAGGYVTGGRVEGDLAVSRGLGDFRFKNMDTVMAGVRGRDDNEADQDENQDMIFPENQKVSPVPDIIVQTRNAALDEFVVVACDGIWDVQTNLEGIHTVAEIFEEGEADMGLVCEEFCDICLRKGSKDNMTALIIKFIGQKIGDGGGVLARRARREAEAQAQISEMSATGAPLNESDLQQDES